MAVLERRGLKKPISTMRPGFIIDENVGEARRVEKKSFCPIHHISCPQSGNFSGTRVAAFKSMARKLNSWKVSQATGGPAAVSPRQPLQATAAQYLQYLTKFRPQPFRIPSSPVRQQISVQIEEQPQTPCVVKFIQRG